jgi:tRNA pseudouridine32 synthase/23S rRNA pseudouridine746 synthase
VLGRHAKALARLGELFKTNKVDKIYWALVEGGPAQDEGEIDLPLGPQSPERPWWMKVDPKGLPALTRWRVLGRSPGAESLTFIELRPITGRTHQLRVHCAAKGWPILGDTLYGTAPRTGGPGLHLQAHGVSVPLYPKKPPIRVEAPLPAHMREAVQACGG